MEHGGLLWNITILDMGYEVIVFLILVPFQDVVSALKMSNHFEMYLKPITCGILQSCGMRHWVVVFVILVILRD